MKIIRYGLLFLILIGLVSLAAAAGPVYTQSFKELNDVSFNTIQPFVYGATVFDTVNSNGGYMMSFSWYYPDGSFAMYTEKSVRNNQYSDFIDTADQKGSWTVSVLEKYYSGIPVGGSTANFEVSEQLPEFGYGSFISLLLSGVLYFILRRNVVGSFNANR